MQLLGWGIRMGLTGELNLDPYFLANMEGCYNNNIPVSVYFSSYAKSKEEAESQANCVVENLKANDYNNLWVSFDWENWKSFNKLNLSLNDINNISDTFLNRIKDLNYNPVLYGSKTYLEAVWKNPNNYPVWLANYVSHTNYQGKYKIWQLCQTGIIDGINGKIDINVMYKNLDFEK